MTIWRSLSKKDKAFLVMFFSIDLACYPACLGLFGSLTGSLIYLATVIPFGWILGRFMKSRLRRFEIEQWRAAHPDLSDAWLPTRLKDKRG